MNVDSQDFIYILQDRIEAIRGSIRIDPTKQLMGIRFKDTYLTVETIQGALLVHHNPHFKGKMLQEAVGLLPSRLGVLSGQFDPLIRIVLGQYAYMDFEAETRLDLH